MAAGLAVLGTIAEDTTLYARLDALTQQLSDGLEDVMERHGLAHTCVRAGSMFTLYFTQGPVDDLESAQKSDRGLFANYFGAMLERGIYLAPSQFETNFLSAAHTARDVDRTLVAADASVSQILTTA
jgi:glutamate-1-semialdehyde 2,1-aminomutase